MKTTIAGAIVHLLVSVDLKTCNAGAIGKYLADQLAEAHVAAEEFEPLLKQLEEYLAVLHSKENSRARDLANEVDRAIHDLVGRVRTRNGNRHEPGVSQKTGYERRCATEALEEELAGMKWGGTD